MTPQAASSGFCRPTCSAAYAEIELGIFPSTASGNRRLAEAVRAIRDTLGCRLRVDNKDVADATKRRVCITLRPVDFPTVRILYARKLPKEAKCRIVRQVSRYKALREFVEAIDVAGGVRRDKKGYPRPLGDEDWIDLGEAYLLACEALGREPKESSGNDDVFGDQPEDDSVTDE